MNIYFIQELENGARTGQYKIGLTIDPEKRLKQLQVGNPRKLVIAHYFSITELYNPGAIEKYLHLLLEDFNSEGEWFSFNVYTRWTLHVIETQGITSYFGYLSDFHNNKKYPKWTAWDEWVEWGSYANKTYIKAGTYDKDGYDVEVGIND